MKNSSGRPSSKKKLLRILLVVFVILVAGVIYLFNSYNKLLADALLKSFNSNIASDVYELKFKDLNVNLFTGSIVVNDVSLIPREKPLNDYPEINSSFRLTTKKLLLSNVEIVTLLRQNRLKLERIEIAEPEILFTIADTIPIFIPYDNSPKDSIQDKPKANKRLLAFSLQQFDLINASWHVDNYAKGRNLDVKQVNFSLRDFEIGSKDGKGSMTYSNINLSVGEINGSLQKDNIKYIHLKGFELNVDSLKVEKKAGKLVYEFQDISLGMKDLDLHTADSIFHVAINSFDLSYKNRSLVIGKILFKPNIGEEAMQKRFQFQNTQFSGTVGLLKISGIEFDSLFYKKKLMIQEIMLDSVSANIFKDKTKPMDLKKFPVYLGQTIKGMKMPLRIQEVIATNVNLVNKEKKVDASFALAHINRGTLKAANITNIDTLKVFSLQLSAYLENKVAFSAALGFDYLKPQFSLEGSFGKFDLADLNQLINSYTPAKINSGVVDELKFSGTAFQKKATGTMKFLYHDLNVDMELKEKAKWKSSLLAFAANTVVASSNPTSENNPPKIVQYEVERDMNKGFVNIVIKSALSGLKETVYMSKENRKSYKENKKKAKAESKKK